MPAKATVLDKKCNPLLELGMGSLQYYPVELKREM